MDLGTEHNKTCRDCLAPRQEVKPRSFPADGRGDERKQPRFGTGFSASRQPTTRIRPSATVDFLGVHCVQLHVKCVRHRHRRLLMNLSRQTHLSIDASSRQSATSQAVVVDSHFNIQ